VQNSTLIKLFVALTVLICLAVAVLNFLKLNAPETAKIAPAFTRTENYSASYKPFVPKAVKLQPDSDDAESGEKETSKLSREQVEAWLAKHNRNASSLLAAFRAMGDTNYLNEAATNFPNDSHVELAVLARDEFPADRRKWLDLFKASSPSNSLANYFSAEDDFKNGKPDEAMQELLAASGKPQFDNHAMEAQLDAEELYLDSGKSSRVASSLAMSDMSEENMPELATIKRTDQGIAGLIQQKMAAGDADSAANLAEMGMVIADKLNSDDSGKYLINQLVGTATAAIVLQHLDQNTAYDFLDGQTPAQVTEVLKQQRTELRKLMADFISVEFQMIPSESEMASYNQRVKIYGEVEAMKWAIQQHPSTDSQK
jgi:hypothetical protein